MSALDGEALGERDMLTSLDGKTGHSPRVSPTIRENRELFALRLAWIENETCGTFVPRSRCHWSFRARHRGRSNDRSILGCGSNSPVVGAVVGLDVQRSQGVARREQTLGIPTDSARLVIAAQVEAEHPLCF